MRERGSVRVLDSGEGCPELPLVETGGIARAVVWPGVGAEMRSMHRIELAPGGRTRPQSHAMEAVYFVVSGAASVSGTDPGPAQPLVTGSMVHVGPNTAYVFEAGADGALILGGPCPADPALYRALAEK